MRHPPCPWSDDKPVLRPFELQPLLDLLTPRIPITTQLRVSGSRLARLRRKGWLTGLEADRLAVAAGYHPSEVWGRLWAADDVAAMFERLREEKSA